MGICNVAGMCLNRQPTETVIELDDLNSTDKLVTNNDQDSDQDKVGFLSEWRCKIVEAGSYLKNSITNFVYISKPDIDHRRGDHRRHREPDIMEFAREDGTIDHITIEPKSEENNPSSNRTQVSRKCKAVTVFGLIALTGLTGAAIYKAVEVANSNAVAAQKGSSLSNYQNNFDGASASAGATNNTHNGIQVVFDDPNINKVMDSTTKFAIKFLNSFTENFKKHSLLQKQSEIFATSYDKTKESFDILVKICDESECNMADPLSVKNDIYEDDLGILLAGRNIIEPPYQSYINATVEKFNHNLRGLVLKQKTLLKDMQSIHQKLGDTKNQTDRFHYSVDIDHDFRMDVVKLLTDILQKYNGHLSHQEDTNDDINAEKININRLKEQYDAVEEIKIENLRSRVIESQQGDCIFPYGDDCDNFIKKVVKEEIKDIVNVSHNIEHVKLLEKSAESLDSGIFTYDAVVKTSHKLEKDTKNDTLLLNKLDEKIEEAEKLFTTSIDMAKNSDQDLPKFTDYCVDDISAFIKDNPDSVNDVSEFRDAIKNRLEHTKNTWFEDKINSNPKLKHSNTTQSKKLTEEFKASLKDFFKRSVNSIWG